MCSTRAKVRDRDRGDHLSPHSDCCTIKPTSTRHTVRFSLQRAEGVVSYASSTLSNSFLMTIDYQKFLTRTIIQSDKVTTRSSSRSTRKQEFWRLLGSRGLQRLQDCHSRFAEPRTISYKEARMMWEIMFRLHFKLYHKLACFHQFLRCMQAGPVDNFEGNWLVLFGLEHCLSGHNTGN